MDVEIKELGLATEKALFAGGAQTCNLPSSISRSVQFLRDVAFWDEA